ncbi:MAG: hypothetical protein SCK57_05155 [Bacillota bacterium]|nr:hypothetical protein [Bacillota bacterium]MDW7677029.1 hypothetical protein [Bacillota bacterium]
MLKNITFSPEDLQIKCVFRNQPLLQKLHEQADFSEVPGKVARLYGPLFFPEAPPERPYLTGCLVLSMDGRLGFGAHPGSRTLTSSNHLDASNGLTDLWMLNLVRTWSDAILFGSATLRDEAEFTGHVYDPDLQAFREAHPGRFVRTPWNVLITRQPETLPWEHPVLSTPQIPVLLVIPENRQEALVRCQGGQFCYGVLNGREALEELVTLDQVAQVLSWDDGRVDPRHLVVTLPEAAFPDFKCLLPLLRRLGIRQMAVESPHWIWRLMDEKVLDEFFLNYTGVYTGGTAVPGSETSFAVNGAPVMELASLHLTSASVLMSRQILRYGQQSETD